MNQPSNCYRCGVRCRVADTSNAEARLLRHATEPHGLCVNCGATQWLKENVGEVIANQRCRKCDKHRESYGRRGCACSEPDFPGIDDILRLEHIQKTFAQLMAVGKSDAKPDEIDWLEVIANWELPFPDETKPTQGQGELFS